MSTKKLNRNQQIRLWDDEFSRVQEVVDRSGFSMSDVLRAAIRAGLPLIESGEVNPFSKNYQDLNLPKAAETPAKYKKSSTGSKQKE